MDKKHDVIAVPEIDPLLYAQSFARSAAEPRVSPREQAEFQKRLNELGQFERMALLVLRATPEQLRQLDEDMFHDLVNGTDKAKRLYEYMETAELRFKEIVLNGRPDPVL
jgi:hypothetical protein